MNSVSETFIGGLGLTHLAVYNQRPGPDGIHAGCAHVHALTAEAYYVISGTGAIELHDLERGFRSIPLGPGDYVQFPPNTLHRSVNGEKLTVLALMTNAGLAERGDARIYFGPDVDADPEAFERLKALPRERGLEGALERRDASAREYQRLLAMWEDDRESYWRELQRFCALHSGEMRGRAETFRPIIAGGPEAWVADAFARLAEDRPRNPVIERPAATGVTKQDRHLGMCGLLHQLCALQPV
ncbi:MAG: cupin domain-containing protein [Azospirillaceae bacterium]